MSVKPQVLEALQNQVETNNTQETRERVALEFALEEKNAKAAKEIENNLINSREPNFVSTGHGNAVSRKILSETPALESYADDLADEN